MKHVTLCGGSGTRSRFRLGSPKYRAVPVVQTGKCANGWNRRILLVPARSGGGRLTERTPAVQPRRRERVKVPQSRQSQAPGLRGMPGRAAIVGPELCPAMARGRGTYHHHIRRRYRLAADQDDRQHSLSRPVYLPGHMQRQGIGTGVLQMLIKERGELESRDPWCGEDQLAQGLYAVRARRLIRC
jgi:hypothetical protein